MFSPLHTRSGFSPGYYSGLRHRTGMIWVCISGGFSACKHAEFKAHLAYSNARIGPEALPLEKGASYLHEQLVTLASNINRA